MGAGSPSYGPAVQGNSTIRLDGHIQIHFSAPVKLSNQVVTQRSDGTITPDEFLVTLEGYGSTVPVLAISCTSCDHAFCADNCESSACREEFDSALLVLPHQRLFSEPTGSNLTIEYRNLVSSGPPHSVPQPETVAIPQFPVVVFHNQVAASTSPRLDIWWSFGTDDASISFLLETTSSGWIGFAPSPDGTMLGGQPNAVVGHSDGKVEQYLLSQKSRSGE